MSGFGKLLAVLNVLAAIAFVVFAGMDWGQRQRWAYAAYLHDVIVDGLPIDDKERMASMLQRPHQPGLSPR